MAKICGHCKHYTPDNIYDPKLGGFCSWADSVTIDFPMTYDDHDPYVEFDEDAENCATYKKSPPKRAEGKEEEAP